MTLGHVVTTGMEIVCYLTKSCIPNLIFSSSFSNCVGTLLMIKIHDPGHPLMHELIEKSLQHPDDSFLLQLERWKIFCLLY